MKSRDVRSSIDPPVIDATDQKLHNVPTPRTVTWLFREKECSGLYISGVKYTPCAWHCGWKASSGGNGGRGAVCALVRLVFWCYKTKTKRFANCTNLRHFHFKIADTIDSVAKTAVWCDEHATRRAKQAKTRSRRRGSLRMVVESLQEFGCALHK